MRFALRFRLARLTVLSLGVMALSGCELVMGLFEKSPEKRLVETVKAEWASPGGQFVNGVYSRDTIASVEATGRRSWRVMIPDQGALGEDRTWELELDTVEVYRVVPGEEFARFLNEAATELDRRAALPRESWLLLAQGDVLAVGHVTARVPRTAHSHPGEFRQIAYLRPVDDGDARWTLEPEVRSSVRLRDALRLVYDHMILRDERVLTCMGTLEPSEVPRPEQLGCVGEVLSKQFDGE